MAILNTVAQFGQYMLRTHLATASVCEVWLAEADGAPRDTSPVVFKKLRADLAQNQALVESFASRARRNTSLTHECIARVLEVVVSGSECGFAMEYLDGKTLRQLISAVCGAGNAVPVWFAIHVARCICHALQHAHEAIDKTGRLQPLFHENLRPESVFLTFQGQVKVTDFGLSHPSLLQGSGTPSHFSTPARGGSNSKVSPTDSGHALRNDLVAVGRVLYELLTGAGPGSTDGPETEYLPPSQVAPWVNADVDQILSRILGTEESGRFGTARELGRALDEYLASRRHDVTETHIAGLVAVLFSAACRDSSPPTMRLHQSAVEMALLRARRTTPPDFASSHYQSQSNSTISSIPAPTSSQLLRQTVPSFEPAEPSPTQSKTTVVSEMPSGGHAQESKPSSDNTQVAETRTSPFHHDWDLALKRARQESQAGQRAAEGTSTEAVKRPSPPLDPMERAVIEFEQGLEHMRSGDFEGALKAWERALEFDPQHRICRANLNLLKKRLGANT